MKRSLVAATAVALLLTGCATGDTGHLDPDIEPELVGPRSTPEPEAEGTGDDDGTTDAGSGAPTDLEAAFEEAAGSEAWFDDVTGVEVDGSSVRVTTALAPGATDAVAVCQATVDAVESTGTTAASVEVLAEDGTTLSGLDAAAGDEGCSS